MSGFSTYPTNKAKRSVFFGGDQLYMLRPLKSVGDGSVPKSLISLTIANGDPLRWYSVFVGIFFLGIFKALHLGMLRHISQVSFI